MLFAIPSCFSSTFFFFSSQIKSQVKNQVKSQIKSQRKVKSMINSFFVFFFNCCMLIRLIALLSTNCFEAECFIVDSFATFLRDCKTTLLKLKVRTFWRCEQFGIVSFKIYKIIRRIFAHKNG